jgi:hypothetical protein
VLFPCLYWCVLSWRLQEQRTRKQKKPNILVIFGDDIGQTNSSAYGLGVAGYRTPNIDRIAKEGMLFTDYYAENSCTPGRSSFITGQTPKRTGLSKVGIPGAPVGLQARDVTLAQARDPQRLDAKDSLQARISRQASERTGFGGKSRQCG